MSLMDEAPKTVEDLKERYKRHSKEELLEAVAQLHVTNLEQFKKIDALLYKIKTLAG